MVPRSKQMTSQLKSSHCVIKQDDYKLMPSPNKINIADTPSNSLTTIEIPYPMNIGTKFTMLLSEHSLTKSISYIYSDDD